MTGDLATATAEAPTEALSWQYGLFAPLDWGVDCEAELRRMGDLWNKLVEIGRQTSAEYRAVIDAAGNPELAETRAEIIAKLDYLKAERRAVRKAAHKAVATPALDEEIASCRALLASLADRLKADRAAAHETTKARRRAIEDAHLAAVTAARQQSGLYWGNYNAVIESYEVSRQRAIESGAELRFRRSDGSGRLVNQIQGGATAEKIMAGECPQVSIRRATENDWPKPRLHPRGCILTITAFTRDRVRRAVSWPFIMDRDFPPGAVVKAVAVRRRCQVGRRDEWMATFIIRRAAERPINTGMACGIDIGWRRLNDGIRYAMLVDESGHRDQFVIPEAIVDGADHAEALASAKDLRINAAVARLRALDWSTAPDALRDMAHPVRTLPRIGAGMLIRLARLWQQSDWEWDAFDALRADLRADLRDTREIAGLKRRLALARREVQRIAAKRIATTYGLIAIEQLTAKSMVSDPNSEIPKPSHRYRQIAAPFAFLESLAWAAHKSGATIYRHKGKSTWICASCGTEQEPIDRAALVATCPHCQATWDVDVNAAHNLLAAALASADVAAETTPALAPGDQPTVASGRRWSRIKQAAAAARSRNHSDSAMRDDVL